MRPILATKRSAPRRATPRFAGGPRTCWSTPSTQPPDRIMMAIDDATLKLDPEEARRVRQERLERVGKWVLLLAIMVLAIVLWDRICVWNEIPQYILPRPGVVLQTLHSDEGLLFSSLLVTLRITFL